MKEMKRAATFFRRNRIHLSVLIILLATYMALSYFTVFQGYEDLVDKALLILAYILMGWILMRVLDYAFNYTLRKKFHLQKADNLYERQMQTKLRYIHAILNVVIWLIVAALIFFLFEELRTIGSSILVSAGITSVIVGFAAQKSISNLIAGFQIAFTQPITIDDAVFVEGQWGWIEEITLTYVVVKVWDRRRLVLPISYFVENPFQNWTKVSADLLGTVFLYVDYRVPVDKLRSELNRILKKDKLWDGEVGIIQVTETTQTCVELRVLVSARNSPEAFDLRCHVREKLIDYLQKNYPESLPVTRAEVQKE